MIHCFASLQIHEDFPSALLDPADSVEAFMLAQEGEIVRLSSLEKRPFRCSFIMHPESQHVRMLKHFDLVSCHAQCLVTQMTSCMKGFIWFHRRTMAP